MSYSQEYETNMSDNAKAQEKQTPAELSLKTLMKTRQRLECY
jgi:hypothetical protein